MPLAVFPSGNRGRITTAGVKGQLPQDNQGIFYEVDLEQASGAMSCFRNSRNVFCVPGRAQESISIVRYRPSFHFLPSRDTGTDIKCQCTNIDFSLQLSVNILREICVLVSAPISPHPPSALRCCGRDHHDALIGCGRRRISQSLPGPNLKRRQQRACALCV